MIGPLCVITDAEAPLPLVEQAEAAARGGATLVQLRHKTLDDTALAELARALQGRLAPLGARLVINDRVAVACAIGAHGLHVGQDDGDPRAIRVRIGPDMLLGLSVEAPGQLGAVPEGVVDYLGVGPYAPRRANPTTHRPWVLPVLPRSSRRHRCPAWRSAAWASPTSRPCAPAARRGWRSSRR